MTLIEELITQAQNFDKGSTLRGLLERAAHRITELERESALHIAEPAGVTHSVTAGITGETKSKLRKNV